MEILIILAIVIPFSIWFATLMVPKSPFIPDTLYPNGKRPKCSVCGENDMFPAILPRGGGSIAAAANYFHPERGLYGKCEECYRKMNNI